MADTRGLFAMKLSILIVGTVLFASSTHAAEPPKCLPGETVIKVLHDQFKEQIVWRGLTADGRLAVMTASPGGKTWTIVLVGHDGQVCQAVAGTEAQSIKPQGAAIDYR